MSQRKRNAESGIPGGSMPRCLRCGKVYQVRYITGYCTECLELVNPEKKPTLLSPSSEVSLESYEEEVERIHAGQNSPKPKIKTPGYSSWKSLVAFSFVGLLLITSLVITVIAFGLTKHALMWSLSIIFFFFGAANIMTKRLLGRRFAISEAGEQIEPALARVIGGLCLLPLALCTFYYGMNTDMPPNDSLWMVGIMIVAALAALIGGSIALSKAQ